jgi:hypothetical protein
MANPTKVVDLEDPEDDIDTLDADDAQREPSPSQPVVPYISRKSPPRPPKDSTQRTLAAIDKSIAVLVPPPVRPWEYAPFRGHITIDTVLEEVEGPGGERWFLVEYEDGNKEKVSDRFDTYFMPLVSGF